MKHTFVYSSGSDPWSHSIRVSMCSMLSFLNTSARLKLCSFRVLRTVPMKDMNTYVRHFVTIPGSGHRTYKFAEGCVNLSPVAGSAGLPDDKRVLQVQRACDCGAVQWTETVTMGDVRERTVCLKFTSSKAVHNVSCVRPGATDRARPLIGAFVSIKEQALNPKTTAMDIEGGNVALHRNAHDLTAAVDVAAFSKNVSRTFIREGLKNARSAGRQGMGDFDCIHRLAVEHCRAAEDGDKVDSMTIVEYHPAVNVKSDDVNNPESHWWLLAQMPYAQEDMEAYAPTCGVAYDAKVKGIRDGLLIMPICTTRAAQACVRNTDTGVRMPIRLLRNQHITHVNYVLLANTESNILITAVMNTIHGLLTCTHDDCGHACTVVRDAMGGFKLHREQCRQHPRRGEWTRESFDACASYLRSSYQRMLNHDEWSHLEVPIICRYRQLARSITVGLFSVITNSISMHLVLYTQ